MKALKASLVLLALSVFATPAFGEVNANTSGTSLIGAGSGAALHDCANDGGGVGRISAGGRGGRDTAVQSDALGENSEFRWFACALLRLPAAARRKGGGSGNVPRATREDRRAIQTALKAEGFNLTGFGRV